MNIFNTKQEEDMLLRTTVIDYVDALPISIVNAWYLGGINSITVPFGIAQDPIFNKDHPISAIYGGIGVVIGHEIVHAFDDNGVEFDEYGYKNNWLDENGRKNFGKIKKCVVDQYGKFTDEKNNTLDGEHTKSENIADNGGKRL